MNPILIQTATYIQGLASMPKDSLAKQLAVIMANAMLHTCDTRNETSEYFDDRCALRTLYASLALECGPYASSMPVIRAAFTKCGYSDLIHIVPYVVTLLQRTPSVLLPDERLGFLAEMSSLLEETVEFNNEERVEALFDAEPSFFLPLAITTFKISNLSQKHQDRLYKIVHESISNIETRDVIEQAIQSTERFVGKEMTGLREKLLDQLKLCPSAKKRKQ